MSIANLMDDIKRKVMLAPLLEGRVGTAAGGKAGDPTMRKAPTPSAWVVYAGNQSRATQTGTKSTPVTHEVIVKLIVPYSTEAIMSTVSWPVLNQVTEYVTANPVDGLTYCARWVYVSTVMEELDDRIVYEQRYQIAGNV